MNFFKKNWLILAILGLLIINIFLGVALFKATKEIKHLERDVIEAEISGGSWITGEVHPYLWGESFGYEGYITCSSRSVLFTELPSKITYPVRDNYKVFVGTEMGKTIFARHINFWENEENSDYDVRFLFTDTASVSGKTLYRIHRVGGGYYWVLP